QRATEPVCSLGIRRVRNCPGVYRKSSSDPSGMSKTIDLASAVSSITSAIVSSRTKEPSWGVSVMKASLTRGPVGAGACSLREVERVDHVLGVLGIDALGQGDQALRIGVADARKHARAGVLALRDLRAASPLVEDGQLRSLLSRHWM